MKGQLLFSIMKTALRNRARTVESRETSARARRTDQLFRATSTLTCLAVLAWSTAASAQNLVPQPWQGGGYEIRDARGFTQGYVKFNEATGNYEIEDANGNVRQYLKPNPATGGLDIEQQPGTTRDR